MSFSPQEHERLAQILGSIPNLDTMLATLDPESKSSEWDMEDKGFNAEFKRRNFEFRNRTAVVSLSLYEKYTFLSWVAKTPDRFRLESNMDTYLSFLEFTTGELPSMLYGFEDNQAVRDSFVSQSRAELRYKKLQEVKVFKMDSNKDLIKLITEIVTRPHIIYSLNIVGNGEVSGNKFPYRLSIAPFEAEDTNALLGIGIPRQEQTQCGWNKDTLEWVLGTHVKRDRIGNLGIAAQNLLDHILPIAQHGVHALKNPQP